MLSIDNEGIVESDDDANLMYLVMNSSFSNIDMSKTSEPETMLDRSGWTIASYGSSYYGSASSVLDDKYSTSWLTSADGANITIDMGANQSLNGIQLAPNYKYSVKYNASSFEIATSNDNSTWTTQGTYSGETFGGDAYTPDLRNIHFYAPVDARYFRITFDKNTSSSYLAGASEIRGF